MKRVFGYLLPEYVLNWRTFWVTLLWSELLHLSDSTTTPPGSYLERILIIFAGQLVVFGLIWLVSRFVLRILLPSFLTAGLLTAVVLGGAARGVLLYYAIGLLPLVSKADLLTRISSSTSNTFIQVLVVAVVVGAVQAHQRQRALLEARESQLLQLKNAANAEAEMLDNALVADIENQLSARLSEIAEAEHSTALVLIRETIDEVVRPLSQLLLARNPLTPQNAPESSSIKLRWWHVARSAINPNRLSPLAVTLSLVVLGLPIMLSRYGLGWALVMLGCGGYSGGLIIWLAKRFWQKRVRQRQTALATAFWFLLPPYLAGQLIGLVSLAVAEITNKPGPFIYLAPTYAVLLGLLFAIALTAYQMGEDVEAELVLINRRLARAVARAQESQRQRKQAILHVLHGRIQAALSAAYLRLTLSPEQQAGQSQVLDQLQTQVSEALEHLRSQVTNWVSVTKIVTRTQSTWQGVAEIALEIDADLNLRIEHDPICQGALNDLVTELVFNAIKHGNAKNIQVTVADNGDSVELLVVDDGVLKPGGAASSVSSGGANQLSLNKGLGTELLNTCAISWSRRRTPDGTRVQVLLPIEEN